MARFKQESITTVLQAGGLTGEYPHAAGAIGYLPEWLLAGHNYPEQTFASQVMDQSVYAHALTVTTYPDAGARAALACTQAARETEPTLTGATIAYSICPLYDDFRQLFTGIQVAGPRLTPKAMNQGFHAIPAFRSSDPRLPACFYHPSDYSCVKDAQAQWWDPAGQDPYSTQPGCWRMFEDGRRHQPDDWPPGDIWSRHNASDKCNSQGAEPADSAATTN